MIRACRLSPHLTERMGTRKLTNDMDNAPDPESHGLATTATLDTDQAPPPAEILMLIECDCRRGR